MQRNRTLTFLENRNKSSNPRLHRWPNSIQEHNFDIKHIPGQQNSMADVLSRFPVNIIYEKMHVYEKMNQIELIHVSYV
jgi:hypothetical protein